MVNIPTQIPPDYDCNSHSPVFLNLFISFDPIITVAFPPWRNSAHVVVSISIDFPPSNSKRDAPFHRTAYDYSYADWDGLLDHLGDVVWEDTAVSAAAAKLCQRVQVKIDVYIAHRKYQVKPHSSPWSSAACAAVSLNHFFRL